LIAPPLIGPATSTQTARVNPAATPASAGWARWSVATEQMTRTRKNVMRASTMNTVRLEVSPAGCVAPRMARVRAASPKIPQTTRLAATAPSNWLTR
jgi:hypothetical protein